MQKVFCFDYDDTITVDFNLFVSFMKSLERRGHKAIVCTMRAESMATEELKRLEGMFDVYYSNMKGKREYLAKLGISPDVWIDDSPDLIIMDLPNDRREEKLC